MEHLRIVYTGGCQPAIARSLLPTGDRAEGFCRMLRRVFALRHLDDLFGLTKNQRAERHLAAMIIKASRAFHRPAVRVEQLTQSCRQSNCIALLVQNGWRIRKQVGTKSCVIESN